MGLERGMQVLVAAVVFNALAFLFILIRCLSRFVVIKQAGFEDYLIIFSLILSIGMTIVIALQRDSGLGRHTNTFSRQDNKTFAKLLYAELIIYGIGLLIVKDSILYQYLRFFVERRFRLGAWFLIVFITVGGLAMTLTSCFSCQPIAFFSDKSIEGGHCVNLVAFWFCFSAFNIITDLAVLVLPMPVLKRLQLPRKQKISLIAVFALGGFGCITSILRLHSLYTASMSKDLSHDITSATIWSCAELNVGIMCACIPAMRPVISLIFPRLLWTSRRDRSSNPYPRGATYARNDSVVELSQVAKVESDVSREDTVSFDTSHAPNSIHVKQDWSITQAERA